MNIIQKTSPNFSYGRGDEKIEKIVIHWIGAGTPETTINWFANKASQVSAHFLVADDDIYQFVDLENTAWHCGNFSENQRSIGIEHYARPDYELSEESYKTSAELIRQLSEQYNIPLDREHIVGHKEIKSTQCPGTIDVNKLIELAKGENMSECEKELEEMRESRNKWKQKFYDEAESREKEQHEYAKTLREKDESIEAYQKQVSTLSENNSNLTIQNNKLTTDLNKERTDNANLRAELISKGDIITQLNTDLETAKSKAKNKLTNYTRWELFKALIFRG